MTGIPPITSRLRDLKKEKEQADKEMDEYLSPLVKKRMELESLLKEKSQELKPLEDELSQIDAEIETVLRESEAEEYRAEGKKFFISEELAPKAVDIKGVFDWIFNGNDSIEITNKKGLQETYHKSNILLANMISKREITKLVDSGVVPDGVQINTFKKFKINKDR